MQIYRKMLRKTNNNGRFDIFINKKQYYEYEEIN